MEQDKQTKKSKLSTTQVILIVGFSLVLIMIVVIGIFLLRPAQEKPESGTAALSGNGLVIDESNLQQVEEMVVNSVKKGMFEVNMNTNWTFADGSQASEDAYVANGASNQLPITFEVLLDGTENIYTSTVIPVGSRIKEIRLEKVLPAGTYNAVCKYHLWNEDGTESSSVGVNITIIIQN